MPFDVEAIRSQFPILARPLPDGRPLVYLDNAATAQKPRRVIDKLVEVLEQYNANVHRGIHTLGSRVTEELENSREKLQRFIGATASEEVIFTSGTTASINLVAQAWGRKFIKPGDELLLNEMEHHANLVPWQQLAQERGATLKFIPLTADGRLDLDRLDGVLTAKTKLVAVTAMSNVLGTINPIAELAERAHAKGAVILVDGAQIVPQRPINVHNPEIDFLAFSGHKMFGPTGVGVLWGRKELLQEMDPFLSGGNMIRRVWKTHSDFGDAPAKFEAGTAPIAEAIALGAAVDFIESIGWEAFHTHEQALMTRAWKQLHEIPGLKIYGPGLQHRGAIVSFTAEGMHANDLAEILDRQGVAVRPGHHCTMPLHDWLQVPATARASFTIYNTVGEVDALCEAVQKARKIFRLE